jgi:hypothetical protein
MIDTFDATTHGFSLIAVRFERVGCRFGSGIVRPPCLKTRSVRGIIRPYRQTFVFWHIFAPALPAPRLPAFRPAALRCSAGSVGRSLHPLRCFTLAAISAACLPNRLQRLPPAFGVAAPPAAQVLPARRLPPAAIFAACLSACVGGRVYYPPRNRPF